jgi:hypothetical protein
MNISQSNVRPRWSTSSIGECTGSSPMELSALRDHLDECHASRGRLFALKRAAESLNAFVARRPVTIWTAVLMALLIVTSLR